jgi:hypothetical protein
MGTIATFDDVQFPADLGWGFRGGPGMHTTVLANNSGAEQRNINWAGEKCRYNVGHILKDNDGKDELLAFFHGRGGIKNAYRFKDWIDYIVQGKHGGGRTIGPGLFGQPSGHMHMWDLPGQGDNADQTAKMLAWSDTFGTSKVVNRETLAIIGALTGGNSLTCFATDALGRLWVGAATATTLVCYAATPVYFGETLTSMDLTTVVYTITIPGSLRDIAYDPVSDSIILLYGSSVSRVDCSSGTLIGTDTIPSTGDAFIGAVNGSGNILTAALQSINVASVGAGSPTITTHNINSWAPTSLNAALGQHDRDTNSVWVRKTTAAYRIYLDQIGFPFVGPIPQAQSHQFVIPGNKVPTGLPGAPSTPYVLTFLENVTGPPGPTIYRINTTTNQVDMTGNITVGIGGTTFYATWAGSMIADNDGFLYTVFPSGLNQWVLVKMDYTSMGDDDEIDEGTAVSLVGSGNPYRLAKRYQDSAGIFLRKITAPCSGLIADATGHMPPVPRLYWDGELMVSGIDYTLDLTTGIVLFSDEPSQTDVTTHFTWSGEFDVWCRFETDVAALMPMTFDSTDWPAIQIVGVKRPPQPVIPVTPPVTLGP